VRGTATAVRSDVVVVPMPGPPARGENLYVLCGANAGLNHPVRVDRITVGRGADNDLVLSDTSVSRHHLVLERTESGWSFRDLESENGTYQKGRFVRQGKLEYGAPLELGRTILVMERGALE